MKRARRVLVTGGAGFIGSNLVERLGVSGADVIVVDDLSGVPKRTFRLGSRS
jgi:nucleoside-diphosphate-sugar epimerase